MAHFRTEANTASGSMGGRVNGGGRGLASLAQSAYAYICARDLRFCDGLPRNPSEKLSALSAPRDR